MRRVSGGKLFCLVSEQGREMRICVLEQCVVKVYVLLGPNPRRNGLFSKKRG